MKATQASRVASSSLTSPKDSKPTTPPTPATWLDTLTPLDPPALRDPVELAAAVNVALDSAGEGKNEWIDELLTKPTGEYGQPLRARLTGTDAKRAVDRAHVEANREEADRTRTPAYSSPRVYVDSPHIKANARIEVNLKHPGDTWQVIAEFSNIGTAYEAVNAMTYGPAVDRVRITTRDTKNRWTCDYNRPAANIRAEQQELNQ
jgi:hypothetical protein